MERRISVIIPVYNCESMLERAIESVVSQSDFLQNELILVDDGSKDGSGQICDKYAEHYENIKVIHQENSGVSVARNNGIHAAEGEWIFFLDSDDYILDGAFEKMLGYGSADIICAGFESNGDETADFQDTLKAGIYNKSDISDELNWLLASSNQFLYTCWSKLFKRSIIVENCVEFPAGRKYAEDMVFVFTYLLYCNTVSLVSDKSYFYNVNDANATSVIPKSFDTFYFIFRWKTDYFSKLQCDSEKINSWLISSFLFKGFFAIKTAASYMKFADAVRYVSEILNNNEFFNLYVESDEYKTFITKTDSILDKFIRKKKPFRICLLFKFLYLKSKLFNR